jgi:hypothetical protein
VSRRMGLFVVARLAARHGIRVRLRPAPTGGLTALVWLPDETVTYEGVSSPPPPRRLDRDRPGAHDSLDALSNLGTPRPEWEHTGRSAVEDAINTARTPKFTAPQPRVQPVGNFPDDTGPIRRETAAPPAVAVPQGQGPLPIYESVESDWFRRSRRSPAQTAAVAATSSSSWTSAADEGWRAAEAVSKPTSNGVTTSGLPKRVPQANLVPGTAGTAGTAGADGPAPSSPSPVRSADAARERFASFQRGVQRARTAAPKKDGS